MRISPFWFLAFIQLVELPIGLYLVQKEKPLKSWNRYYDKWLKQQSLQNESEQDAIQTAIDEAELRSKKKLSVIFRAVNTCFLITVLIALQAFISFRLLFIDVFAPATLMMAVGVLFMYRVRAIAPKTYVKFREIARRRAMSA